MKLLSLSFSLFLRERENLSVSLSYKAEGDVVRDLYINVSTQSETLLLQNLSLPPSLPLSVRPDMALCLPTFSLLLIVNETSLSLSLS